MSVTSGWGRLTWNQANWNEAVTLKTGWGAQAWNDGEWGELKDQTISPTGLSITSSIGALGGVGSSNPNESSSTGTISSTRGSFFGSRSSPKSI